MYANFIHPVIKKKLTVASSSEKKKKEKEIVSIPVDMSLCNENKYCMSCAAGD